MIHPDFWPIRILSRISLTLFGPRTVNPTIASRYKSVTVADPIDARKLENGATKLKTLSRSVSELFILAADTQPLAILLRLPLFYEDKNGESQRFCKLWRETSYGLSWIADIYVINKMRLGRACGASRAVVAPASPSTTPASCLARSEPCMTRSSVSSFKETQEF